MLIGANIICQFISSHRILLDDKPLWCPTVELSDIASHSAD